MSDAKPLTAEQIKRARELCRAHVEHDGADAAWMANLALPRALASIAELVQALDTLATDENNGVYDELIKKYEEPDHA
jgi:hypothetical protein